MSRRLTAGALRAIEVARDEARRLNHDWLGTEHLLAGLVLVQAGGAARVLGERVNESSFREALAAISPAAAARALTIADLPLTARLRSAFRVAAFRVRELGRPKIATEHLLLGLLEDETNAACRILLRLGIARGALRGETLAVLLDPHPFERLAAEEAARRTPAAPIPKPRIVEPPLHLCPRGHGPMEKLREAGGLEVGVCAECLGTFVPAGQLAKLVALAARGPLDELFGPAAG